jgi:hypothetical protein
LVKPAVVAAALHTILYVVGLLVVALYVRDALVVPAQTVGVNEVGVIVGNGLIVTLPAVPVLTQPFAFATVNV